MNSQNFLSRFAGKVVLVTGHTGFKGSWLTAWLKLLGAKVVGIALDPLTEPSLFSGAKLGDGIVDLRIDIRDCLGLENAIVATQPDYVFHLAAQALVFQSYQNPIDTWQTNVMGTLNLLEGLRKLKNPCNAVIITSDKCYENIEWVWGYRETDAMGGIDPYSASKGAAELAIRSYIKSYFSQRPSNIRIATARAGNVIGGGDWSQGRIIPDCVKAWSVNGIVNLRNPHSTRPWQHVLEPLSGYLNLAASLSENPNLHGESFNFGPNNKNHSVEDLVKEMSIYWDAVRWENIKDHTANLYEAGLLRLNCDKALYYFNWFATMGFEDTVKMTAEWYRAYYQNHEKILDFTNVQIESYTALAKKSGLSWAQ